MFLGSSLIVALSVGIACSCDCTEASVQYKSDHSDVVFRGTITALHHSKKAAGISARLGRDTKKTVVFHVIRVWKGEIGQTFEMPAVEETGACIGFWPPLLKVGNDLLVYASRSGASEYYTSICGFHKPAKDAKDFKELGPGEDPLKLTKQNSK